MLVLAHIYGFDKYDSKIFEGTSKLEQSLFDKERFESIKYITEKIDGNVDNVEIFGNTDAAVRLVAEISVDDMARFIHLYNITVYINNKLHRAIWTSFPINMLNMQKLVPSTPNEIFGSIS